MKQIIARIIVVVVAQFILLEVNAQQPAFYNDIQAFKKQDSIKFPPPNGILFVGSSSFTKWTDVSAYFPGKTIINRGFGGSSLPDVIRYEDEIIIPYKPRQVVIYCGENDLASSNDVTAQTVVDRAKQLMEYIWNKLPNAQIIFVSLKPSPSRRHLWPKMMEANAKIRDYLKTKKNALFVDVYSKMLNKDGTVMGQIFLSDSLHMNAKGYAIWKKALDPYLQNNKSH
jgi:lysophospholipase L1-like esterase